MKVVVTYTAPAAGELNWILGRLPGTPEDQDVLLVEYLASLRARLVEFQGKIPDALCDDTQTPPVYRIKSFDDVWVEYTIEDEKGWFWTRTRTITVTSFRKSRSASDEPQQ